MSTIISRDADGKVTVTVEGTGPEATAQAFLRTVEILFPQQEPKPKATKKEEETK